MNLLQTSAFRKFIFWIGNVRKLSTFPWVTWDNHTPKVSHEKIDEIKKLIKPGDVGLHRDIGFLSNLFIPGKFKHAWIFVDQDEIIEATKEGVLQKSCRYPMRTDDLVILRPKLSLKARKEAVKKALNIVGFKYDVEFEFDLKEEFFHLNKHDQAFTCIEVIAYAYYQYFEVLGFEWAYQYGRKVLYPSVVINPAWDVVYSNVPEIKATL
jgi:hypothetical protein